jgi:hypothetical protein
MCERLVRWLGRPLAVAAFALLAGCGFSTSIADIQAHPRDYADKEVTVEGEVKEVFGFFMVKYFTLEDGSGEIGVVTERPLPQKGERIRVTGQVRETFALGDRTALVLLENPLEGRAPAQAKQP